eukprot:gnl/MRDRNA2_/MRDRNA2_293838_c0_seq1.p1 gnl/MRDRNA2_/MRDRNA2_293838_c0~~gnl/MRDRNA2_/MRDRNA2_293838_c0_seq1.p1  ORF type:complete len:289 (+),score=37.40 gnl/MRDRNA2_/MRDRNA2_293838_c0_seq1:68-868(+)
MYADETGLRKCRTCSQGRFQDNAGASSCMSCQIVRYAAENSSVQCSPCPRGASTEGRGSTSAKACTWCPRGYYFDGSECAGCSGLTTTYEPGSPSDSDCVFRDDIAMAVAGSLFALFIAIPVAWIRHKKLERRFKSRIDRLEEEKEQRLEEQLQAGRTTLKQLGHPMVLISPSNFLALDDAALRELHEGVRDAGKLRVLDTAESITTFKALGSRIIFYSYQWLSWERPGPDDLQFAVIKAALQEWGTMTGLEPQEIFVWLDILSIP